MGVDVGKLSFFTRASWAIFPRTRGPVRSWADSSIAVWHCCISRLASQARARILSQASVPL